jgi:hypothetical protein
MTACGFTYRHYRETLMAAREAYAFFSFEAARAPAVPPRFLVLRHDVDYALEDALPMARLEAELGIASAYLVRPHAHYNPFGRPGFAILQEIVRLGHALGVHYDRSFYQAHGLPAAETLREEADRLARALRTPVQVVAEHQPGRHAPPCLEAGGLIDAYAPEFTSAIKYVSDSCQFWREGCLCRWVAAGTPRMQVLVHPEWWSEEGTLADAVLDRWAERRSRDASAERSAEADYFSRLTHLRNRHLFGRKED